MYLLSCKKDSENVVDCFVEHLFVGINHQSSVSDPRAITFTIKYSRKFSLGSSERWDFGDGKSILATGKSVTNTYANSGNYSAKAEVTILVKKMNVHLYPLNKLKFNNGYLTSEFLEE